MSRIKNAPKNGYESGVTVALGRPGSNGMAAHDYRSRNCRLDDDHGLVGQILIPDGECDLCRESGMYKAPMIRGGALFISIVIACTAVNSCVSIYARSRLGPGSAPSR